MPDYERGSKVLQLSVHFTPNKPLAPKLVASTVSILPMSLRWCVPCILRGQPGALVPTVFLTLKCIFEKQGWYRKLQLRGIHVDKESRNGNNEYRNQSFIFSSRLPLRFEKTEVGSLSRRNAPLVTSLHPSHLNETNRIN